MRLELILGLTECAAVDAALCPSTGGAPHAACPDYVQAFKNLTASGIGNPFIDDDDLYLVLDCPPAAAARRQLNGGSGGSNGGSGGSSGGSEASSEAPVLAVGVAAATGSTRRVLRTAADYASNVKARVDISVPDGTTAATFS